MKHLIRLVVALILCPIGRSQSISLTQLTGPGGAVRDADYGVSFVCPTGWELRQGARWGDQEATLLLEAPAMPEASPAVYYQAYYEPFAPTGGFEAWLRSEAVRKARLRARDDGYPDYINRADSYIERTIGDSAALSWVADYTRDGNKWCELLTHVVNAHGHALFFVKVPAGKVADLQPGYEALGTTLRLEAGTVLRNLNPLILEGRKLYTAGEHRKAAEAFADAFKIEPIRANDLVVGAAAAALAGERELALQWLRLAVTKGWTLTQRLTSTPDFASLHATDAWKQLIASLQLRTGGVDTVTDKPLQAELLAILDEDQKYRRQIGDVEKKFGRDSPELRELWATIKAKDAINLAAVKEILDRHGWIGPEAVGRQANGALFLVIQHADKATQQKYLPMMREAVKDGKAQASSLALLEDRVALGEGRQQIYGSQIGRDTTTGKYYVPPLVDPDRVDERRASVGLPPLADYVNRWDIAWDVEAFKREQAERRAGKD